MQSSPNIISDLNVVLIRKYICVQEVTGGLHDLDRSRNEALSELEQLHYQKDNLEGHLESLKHNLNLVCFLKKYSR